ncbi:hypothetical protein AK830_g9697 [Neonectria ditissima]|uniref:DUF1857-domain-containing protein n=1 Tax=Neonectria ditissima TaxID=78410 RepID=A0A0N8H5Q9_9HYPO|nr:hypothetical protein AK830_g9697 [Neonectria ditissima]
MVVLNLAYTAPINPPGASPTLTQVQVWAGLRLKALRPQEFVPAITACEIISAETIESGYKVVRDVTFSSDSTIKADRAPVREICYHYAPNRVEFQQEDGSRISNIISRGEDGGLFLTYSFEWRHREVAEGSDQARTLEESHWKVAKMAVEKRILSFRRLVTSGEIQ